MAYTGASDMAPNPLSLDVVGRVGEPIRVNKEKAKTGRSILLKRIFFLDFRAKSHQCWIRGHFSFHV